MISYFWVTSQEYRVFQTQYLTMTTGFFRTARAFEMTELVNEV